MIEPRERLVRMIFEAALVEAERKGLEAPELSLEDDISRD